MVEGSNHTDGNYTETYSCPTTNTCILDLNKAVFTSFFFLSIKMDWLVLGFVLFTFFPDSGRETNLKTLLLFLRDV